MCAFLPLHLKTPLPLLPPAAPGARIGLLGGSFNPPHAGHIAVSRAALQRLKLDRVWWLVSPGNPLKEQKGLAPVTERLKQCHALVRDPRITVTGFERDLGTAYAAATLAYLRRRAPRTQFVWLMGADNLAQFHRWRAWRDVAALMPFAVLDRPSWRHAALASPAAYALSRWRLPEAQARLLAGTVPPAWAFLSIPLSALSSTALRTERRRAGEKPPPDAIW